MAKPKVSHLQETKKSDQQQSKTPEIPGDYYVTREQLTAIRHVVFAAQGIRREFEEQDELLGVAELFQAFRGDCLPSWSRLRLSGYQKAVPSENRNRSEVPRLLSSIHWAQRSNKKGRGTLIFGEFVLTAAHCVNWEQMAR